MRPLSLLAALNAVVLAAGVLVAAGAEQVPVPPPAAAEVVAVPAAPSPRAAAPLTVRTSTPAPAAPRAAAAPRPAPSPPPVVRATRSVLRTGYRPYATVGPVVLHYPGDVVEVVGLHESGNDGALPQSPVAGTRRIGLLESRSRGTSPQGSADIVVDPTRPVRSPVTGTVLRAGSYALYCDEVDHFLVVEPDARPGWEVKLLHFEGLAVRAGDRVQAGRTVVGSRARLLPFASQVDDHTAAPHWPHLHLEVVDPAVPDRPSGSSCD